MRPLAETDPVLMTAGALIGAVWLALVWFDRDRDRQVRHAVLITLVAFVPPAMTTVIDVAIGAGALAVIINPPR